MIAKLSVGAALLIAVPIWTQTVPDASGGGTSRDPMQVPQPVSIQGYPQNTAGEARSNFVRAGLTMESAYDDNVLQTIATKPIHDWAFSVRPNISLDQVTPRFSHTLSARPGFIFYQDAAALNQADISASYLARYRFSPYSAFTVMDDFVKGSNVFNQDNALGLSQSLTSAIPAYTDHLSNAASGQFSYQYNVNRMIGASGTTSRLNYPETSQVSGLCNFTSYGAGGFYNDRFSQAQYAGLNYEYSKSEGCSTDRHIETQTHTIYFYYSASLHTLSISVSGGPQYYITKLSTFSLPGSWTPAATGSLKWQTGRTNLNVNAARTFTGGTGMMGSFHSSTATVDGRWQFARSWFASIAAGYQDYRNVNPMLASFNQGGHTASGGASVERRIGEHLEFTIRYDRRHQTYKNVAIISANPDSNRESIAFSYHFDRPLGR